MTATKRAMFWMVGICCLPAMMFSETFNFKPTAWYMTFSYDHPVALRIKPGDRVVTQTVDNQGNDLNEKRLVVGGNPEIGPFYIEGAEPGDTLVVTFEKMETNRKTAHSSTNLAPYTVDPQYLLQRQPGQAPPAAWVLDKEKGVGRLEHPDLLPTMMELPLRPMLGCVATAPARKESIGTGTPGPWGGNMDYNGMGAGAKLMLPVNEPGALLYMGDGHARQGDGEVVGSGMETSLDVTFTVDLIKKKTIAWPRLENSDYIMVIASARPVLEAIQHATTEMSKMLIADYGFNEHGAAAFMGEAVEYEVANIVDPSFTIVAKIKKAYLPKK